MRNVVSYLLAAFCCTFIFSCQKDADPSGPAVKNKIKTYTEEITTAAGTQTQTFNAVYDNNDRLLTLDCITTPGYKFVYQYPNNKEFTMDIYGAGSVIIHVTSFINSSVAMLDSTFQYNDTKDSSTEKYIYNSNKQLVKKFEYEYSKVTGSVPDNVVDYTYDNNGNLIKEKDYYGESTFKYDTVIPNTLYQGLVYVNNLKQLPTSEITSGGETFDHTYTFDSDKRVISDTRVGSDGSVIKRTYTYY
jgi:hypothetical protein